MSFLLTSFSIKHIVYYSIYGNEGKQYMEKVIPFYMAYPLSQYFENEENGSKDLIYMKSLYPVAAQRIQKLIEEELVLRDYESSGIYDEYPDKLMLRLIVRKVYERAGDIEHIENLTDLIEVLLYEELIRRRQERRQGRFQGQYFR